MTRSFHPFDRDQLLLMPPSLDEWLEPCDLAFFIIDTVEVMDLRPFLLHFKDGSGQTAYHPKMLLALLLFAYCQGVRSSRQIETMCHRDVGFRVVACNSFPDHTTIARFRSQFKNEICELFNQVLLMCQEVGLLKLGKIAIDGTKIKANASMEANRTVPKLEQLVQTILEEAEQTDRSEDQQFGADKRGDELPEHLRSAASRRAALEAAAKRQRAKSALDKARAKAQAALQREEKKVAKQKQQRAKTGKKSPAKKSSAKKSKSKSTDAESNQSKGNLTDPDSSLVKARSGFMQGYNSQAAVTEDQIIIATRIAPAGCDTNQLVPMLNKISDNLNALGIKQPIGAVMSDAGYWCHESVEQGHQMLSQTQTKLYVAVPQRYAKVKSAEQAAQGPPENCSLIERLEYEQRSPEGKAVYRIRAQTVEPVFGQIKSARRCDRFMQRGIEKVEAEWTLMATTHNLLKVWRHTRVH